MAVSTYVDKVYQTSGLRAYWRFEGNTQDSFFWGYHGTQTGLTWGHGSALLDEGQSAFFNGSGAHVTLGDIFTFPNKDPFTIEAWCYPVADPASGYMAIISKEDLGRSPDCGWSFHVDNANNRWGFSRYDTNPVGYSWVFSGNNTVSTTGWTYVVATYDGTNLRLYINGSLAGTTYANYTARTSPQGVTMGKESGAGYWNGFLDEIAIYNRALSTAEVADHYASRLVHQTNTFLTLSDADVLSETSTYAALEVFPLADARKITSTEAWTSLSVMARTDQDTITAVDTSALVTVINRTDNDTITATETRESFATAAYKDARKITSARTLTLTSSYPTVLNGLYADEIIERSALIHRQVARRLANAKITYLHKGIFEGQFYNGTVLGQFILGTDRLSAAVSTVDDVTVFVVFDAFDTPRMVGKAFSDWDGSTVDVVLDSNFDKYASDLQALGVSVTARG